MDVLRLGKSPLPVQRLGLYPELARHARRLVVVLAEVESFVGFGCFQFGGVGRVAQVIFEREREVRDRFGEEKAAFGVVAVKAGG